MASFLSQVFSTRDWRASARVVGERVPQGWREDAAEVEHVRRMVGGAEAVDFAPCVAAQVARAADANEATWGERFSAQLDDPTWCRSGGKFDAKWLCGRPMPGLGGAFVRPDQLLVAERSYRHTTGKFVSGWEVGAAVPAGRQSLMHPALVDGWNGTYEVPFGLKVPSPAQTCIWRFVLAEAPLREDMLVAEPQVRAMWCAAFTLYAQDAAVALLRGMRWGEMWRLPPALVECMLSVGMVALVGTRGRDVDVLHRALCVMKRIAWSRVDPAAGTRPKENMVGAPVYQSGDKVPWGESPHGARTLTFAPRYGWWRAPPMRL